METANFVTYPEMLQLFAIFSGIWFAIFSLAVGFYIWDSNRRDKDNDRRHQETKEENERRHKEAESNNERRHQELLRAISLLYRHVHADGSPAIVPLADVEPSGAPAAAPAPADN